MTKNKLKCINGTSTEKLNSILENKKIAKKIIDERFNRDGFESVGELLDIEGVNRDLLVKISRKFTIKKESVSYHRMKIEVPKEKFQKAYFLISKTHFTGGEPLIRSGDSKNYNFELELMVSPEEEHEYKKRNNLLMK
ncbi:hypothetical protein [Halarsenatibacter silvermanii]|uniref:Helix-hairpin-helix motif-containing protein n=1 Tax=Halarsenatibacter silvermanii TaxID=321763 RepID=A0A1G9RUC5_9FIRM|nr:hypothetical protein [Halarsenatibacter silvermanii]SDM26836.1 hypothetical protein SAMN04488692_12410 [Halarsenatibacter silvermanii]